MLQLIPETVLDFLKAKTFKSQVGQEGKYRSDKMLKAFCIGIYKATKGAIEAEHFLF